uniref:Uncharacterized protein n=1 Tax=Tetraselmis sp. GSL018 TaxID=582737 RepID=A0A061SJ19_9CHLO|eukprot:CAMPEP_0177586570 /NCGR_PEP_ID=MMETSP0419_2-20121207/5147_1 /TAXON_ID=582737 /ORGANISM="Tetraselmis sp., Strain GSL018" /LENGTH=528 /DNA_ID=CAMNT_0019076479 /DNA_START=303 /DNA_END=1889 /DNA_ORIENTATION=-
MWLSFSVSALISLAHVGLAREWVVNSPSKPGSSNLDDSVLSESQGETFDVRTPVNWSAVAEANSDKTCVPHPVYDGCTIPQSHLSIKLGALRNSRHHHIFKAFVVQEVQCRQRVEANCEETYGPAAYAPDSVAQPVKPLSTNLSTLVSDSTMSRSGFRASGTEGAPELGVFGENGIVYSDSAVEKRFRQLKCRWDKQLGCVAYSSRTAMETLAAVCEVSNGRETGFPEPFNLRPVLEREAKAACRKHNSSLSCLAFLGGACHWHPAAHPQAPANPEPLPRGMEGSASAAGEAGVCTLSRSEEKLEELSRTLDCQGTEAVVGGFVQYQNLLEVCGSASTHRQCAALTGAEPCVWELESCRPSPAALLRPMGTLGMGLAEDLRSCAVMYDRKGVCEAPGFAVEHLGLDHRENPVTIMVIIACLLTLGLACLRRASRPPLQQHSPGRPSQRALPAGLFWGAPIAEGGAAAAAPPRRLVDASFLAAPLGGASGPRPSERTGGRAGGRSAGSDACAPLARTPRETLFLLILFL